MLDRYWKPKFIVTLGAYLKWLAWSRNVWFNSTCYHPPGDLPFFSYGVVYSPPPGTQKETIPQARDSPFVTHCTHTQKRNNAAFCVQNQDNNIYFCAKACHKHTRKHAEDSNSTPKPMFHYNSRFCRFGRRISVLLLVKDLASTSLVRALGTYILLCFTQ